MFAGLPGQAQSVAQFRDWSLTCAETGLCALSQTLTSANGQVFLATLSLQEADGLVLVLRTPVGPYLPERPALIVSGQGEATFVWSHCTPAHCIATLRPDAALIDAMRRARAMVVGYRLIGAQEPRRIEVSLMGITAGLQALDATRRE